MIADVRPQLRRRPGSPTVRRRSASAETASPATRAQNGDATWNRLKPAAARGSVTPAASRWAGSEKAVAAELTIVPNNPSPVTTATNSCGIDTNIDRALAPTPDRNVEQPGPHAGQIAPSGVGVRVGAGGQTHGDGGEVQPRAAERREEAPAAPVTAGAGFMRGS